MLVSLLYDLESTQPIGNMKRHGGGKYAEFIFYRMADRNIHFSCYYNSKKWINPNLLEVIKAKDISLYDINNSDIEEIIRKSGANRIFSAIPKSSIINLTSCQVIGTVHDLRFLELPHDSIYYKYSGKSGFASVKDKLFFFIKTCFPEYAKKRLIERYREVIVNSPMTIITDSDHTKYEILSYIPGASKKHIRVFYPPNTSLKIEHRRSKEVEKYFLSVSGRVWSKNILRSIIAFDNLVSFGLITDVKYKITGAILSDFKYKVKNPTAFEFMGYVDDDELEKLYSNAYAFVYPSFSEGFGYPPLEAMRYKVPVISSPFTSIAQVIDSGALYFNPFSVEEIMNRMLMILTEDYHSIYSERGYHQYLKVKERQDKDMDSLIDFLISKDLG